MTVCNPDACFKARVVIAVSVTFTQVVTPLVTFSVNGTPVSNALPRPVTRA